MQKRDFIIIPKKEQLTHCVLTAQCVCVRKEMVVSIVRSNPSLMAATKVVLASPFFWTTMIETEMEDDERRIIIINPSNPHRIFAPTQF